MRPHYPHTSPVMLAAALLAYNGTAIDPESSAGAQHLESLARQIYRDPDGHGALIRKICELEALRKTPA